MKTKIALSIITSQAICYVLASFIAWDVFWLDEVADMLAFERAFSLLTWIVASAFASLAFFIGDDQ